jgi:mRNA-degrading endonuclease toxin of MazEF toxin-antitoxin module
VEAHVVELAAQTTQARFYVSEAVPVSQLGESHRQILVPAREASRASIATVTRHAPTELAIRQETQQLRKDSSALVHRSLSPAWKAFAVQIAASQTPMQLSVMQGILSHA